MSRTQLIIVGLTAILAVQVACQSQNGITLSNSVVPTIGDGCCAWLNITYTYTESHSGARSAPQTLLLGQTPQNPDFVSPSTWDSVSIVGGSVNVDGLHNLLPEDCLVTVSAGNKMTVNGVYKSAGVVMTGCDVQTAAGAALVSSSTSHLRRFRDSNSNKKPPSHSTTPVITVSNIVEPLAGGGCCAWLNITYTTTVGGVRSDKQSIMIGQSPQYPDFVPPPSVESITIVSGFVNVSIPDGYADLPQECLTTLAPGKVLEVRGFYDPHNGLAVTGCDAFPSVGARSAGIRQRHTAKILI